jgi:hypothetical protein
MQFKVSAYANLLADSEPCDTSSPTNGRRDLRSSNDPDHAAFWSQNDQKISFLKHSSEAVTDPRLNASIKTAIYIAETTVVSRERGLFARYTPSSRVAPLKGIALIANNPNPLAAEFVPSVTSSPITGCKLNAAAKEFVPTPRGKISKLNINDPEFVPSPGAFTSKLNPDAPEFVPRH